MTHSRLDNYKLKRQARKYCVKYLEEYYFAET
jgi:hypothetical protein